MIKVQHTLDAFDQLSEPMKDEHRLKSQYSYEVRDSEMYRYLYHVEVKANEIIAKLDQQKN